MKNKLLYIITLVVLAGCVSQKKLDNKAVSRIMANPALKDSIGREWEKVNPCVNDTVTKTITGETITTTDTVIVPVTVIDSFETTTAVVKWRDRVITNTKIRVDTIRLTVEDTRRLRLANDSMNYYKGLWIQKTAEASEYKKQRNKSRTYLWILIAILAVGTFFGIKKKIFNF